MSKCDYIIVGAGSAGCVLAMRLTEAGAKVLLLEAGPPDTDPNIWSPNGWPAVWGTERDYAYNTAPQAHAGGRQIAWPRGRTLGGSSSINGLIYVRGHHSDYDSWAYDGCVGWDYASVLPYFKKSEDYEGGANAYHGAGGPLRVSKTKNPHPVCKAAVDAAVEAGFPFNPDCNGEEILGVGYCDLTMSDGKRQSTAAAFLSRVHGRSNLLEVITGAQVTRLAFSGDRCTGVEFEHEGVLNVRSADQEVLLSSGTIGSAQLLMLSGIGDETELKSVGLETRLNLRGVGKNLHDHLLCSVIFESEQEVPPPQNNFLESQMFWKSDSRRLGPDLQPLFMHLPYYVPGMEGPANAWTLCAGIVRPTSRGSLRLASKDPKAAPIMDPNVMATQADLDSMEVAIRICRDIGHQKALDPWRKREVYPGPNVQDKAGLRDYIRQSVTSYHHQVGTCKMGLGEDAVVDPTLRVWGMRGLRIVDASVMPSIVSGNTNAPTIMIAEKAADMILAAA